jgi:hypothetical protein
MDWLPVLVLEQYQSHATLRSRHTKKEMGPRKNGHRNYIYPYHLIPSTGTHPAQTAESV